MTDYFVVDAHAHTYKTAEIGLQAQSGNGQADLTGVPDELMAVMDDAGISRAVQVNMTPALSMMQAALGGLSPEDAESQHETIRQKIVGRIIRRNEWTCEMARDNEQLIAFPSVDPTMTSEEMVGELENRMKNSGATGLKLHPAEGNFFPAQESLMPLYETAQKLSVPIIAHGGLFASPEDYSRPNNFIKLLEDFPELTIVIAHLGHGFFDESIELSNKYPNVFFDTSAVLNGTTDQPIITDDEAVDLIRKIGTDRVMFGTDYPWFHPKKDLERHLNLDLTDAEKTAILGENAKRILGL